MTVQKKLTRLLIFAFVLGSSSFLARADIYTFVDEIGVVHFSNCPNMDARYKLVYRLTPSKDDSTTLDGKFREADCSRLPRNTPTTFDSSSAVEDAKPIGKGPTLNGMGRVAAGFGAANRGDFETALDIWRPFAIEGDASAQFNLGLMFVYGKGVKQDYAQAMKWHRLAADQGHAKAQLNLGVMYENGQGVLKDQNEAVKWYQSSANHGNIHAQNNLGALYQNGQGLTQDYAQAAKWYRLAADQGNIHAQNNLGTMYKNGQGLTQDYIEAHKWFNLAGVSGDKSATKNRSVVEEKMTREQIAEAQKRAAAWKPKKNN